MRDRVKEKGRKEKGNRERTKVARDMEKKGGGEPTVKR